MLVIYNTLSKKKEPLKTIYPRRVKLYVCGMTVYDYCHVGHARIFVCFDVITRYLRSLGYQVTYVRNITDIDDKIIARAMELGESCPELAGRFIEAMHEDERVLGVLLPDEEPRATDHIQEMIVLIQSLVAKGLAYQGSNGDIYYRVKQFRPYGRLSHKSIDKLKIGARVDITEGKEDPLDFVLWKSAKLLEPSWDSPWGSGRPGWHIECSAMSMKCLGEQFDIHGGGFDLIFPHHENEIAQSEGATGKGFVNTWMHVGFVQIDKEKMSKSLGNFFTIREVINQYSPEVVRYFLLSKHYRGPLSYSEEALANARSALVRFYTALRGLDDDGLREVGTSEYADRFRQAMDDDFNTPVALAELFDCATAINIARQSGDEGRARRLASELRGLANILGLLLSDPESFLQSGAPDLSADHIEHLIVLRNHARDQKQWAEADRIRNELTSSGVILEDGPDGTTWRRL